MPKMNPQHPILSIVFLTALGSYIIWFTRKMARDPKAYIARWQPSWPQRQGVYKVIRLIAIVSTLGGLLMLTEPIMPMTPLGSYGSHLALIYLVILAVMAPLTTPRQQKCT
jgi:uncharacterized membrane protein YkgB